MLLSLRRAGVLVSLLSALMAVSCGFFTQTPEVPPDPVEVPQAPSRGPQHEALFLGAASSRVLSVLYPPPAPLSESPPEAKPAGDDVVWLPGYWLWDTTQDDWLWVSGVWVHAPPGRRWTPGYWSVADDGWRWVHGFWTIDPPPPPSSPPPDLAYAPYGSCFNDPGFAFFTGYGMWWPSYGYRPLHAHRRGDESTSLLPSGHMAAPAAVLRGPHAAALLPSLAPSLASSMHAPPSGPLTVHDALAASSPLSSTPTHLDMASILASVPKSLVTPLNPPMGLEARNEHASFTLHATSHGHGELGSPAVLHDHAGRMTSFFLNPHLETVFHEPPSFHGNLSSHSFGGERVGGRGSGGGSLSSGGHGGGHGR